MFKLRFKGQRIHLDLKRVRDEIDGIVRDSAAGAALMAQSLAPVRTGRLRGSIRYERVVGARNEFIYRAKAGGNQAPYAPFVEFGTGMRGRAGITPEGEELARAHGYVHGSKRGMAPRLYMTRSFVFWSAEMAKKIDQYVGELARKIAGR